MKKILLLISLIVCICYLQAQTVDDKLNKAEGAIKGIFKKNKSEKKSNDDKNANPADNNITNDPSKTTEKISESQLYAYSKYDFISGDKIIFQDDLRNEKDGEFPSQFETSGGQGQVYNFQGENVFQTLAPFTIISPRIKGMSYLPDQFTIEFDAYIEGSGESVVVKFPGSGYDIDFYSGEASFTNGQFTGNVPPEVLSRWYPDNKSFHWRHYAIAVNKNILKAYIDQYRVLNVPNFSGHPNSVSFDFYCHSGSEEDCRYMFMKNFRIAAGGIDASKKLESDGKIITHGITFDINKYDLKPESMGTLNMIVQVLKDNPAAKYEIGGHTDNSGDHEFNMSLSQHRAEAVRSQLISMGIDGSRLTTKGYGDSKQITDNNSPEGKANNRRVEFIKK